MLCDSASVRLDERVSDKRPETLEGLEVGAGEQTQIGPHTPSVAWCDLAL